MMSFAAGMADSWISRPNTEPWEQVLGALSFRYLGLFMGPPRGSATLDEVATRVGRVHQTNASPILST